MRALTARRQAFCYHTHSAEAATFTFLWPGFHWQAFLSFHGCFSFFPSSDLFLSHLVKQDLLLLFAELCQQVRVYEHVWQYLFQHACWSQEHLHLQKKLLEMMYATSRLWLGHLHRPSQSVEPTGTGTQQRSFFLKCCSVDKPAKNITAQIRQ